jgi:hypothetical protein
MIGQMLHDLHWLACHTPGYYGNSDSAEELLNTLPVAEGVTGKSLSSIIDIFDGDYAFYDVGGFDLCVWGMELNNTWKTFVWYIPSPSTDDIVYVLSNEEADSICERADQIIDEAP